MPSCPSEPQTSPSRSYPGASSALPPSSITVPSKSTILTPRRLFGRNPVLQAVRAAGIHPDVPANGAGELRTRIRRIEEAVGRNRIGNIEIGHARLNRRRAVEQVDIQDARHLRQTDDDRVLLRNGAAGERGAGAPRHDRNAVAAAIFEHRGHVLRRLGKNDRERHPPIGDKRIRLEGLEAALVADEAAFRQQIGKIGDDFPPTVEDGLPWLQKADRLRHERLPFTAKWYFLLTTNACRPKVCSGSETRTYTNNDLSASRSNLL
jgi:hypothetical protein